LNDGDHGHAVPCLNEKIGGYDQDANYVPAPSATEALSRAYRSGVTLSGSGGLASIPVFDAGAYNDTQGYHYAWFHFAVRERLRKQNGRAGNHVMWRGAVPAEQSWAVIEDWLTAVKSDTSSLAAYDKVIKNKPAKAVDGCPARRGRRDQRVHRGNASLQQQAGLGVHSAAGVFECAPGGRRSARRQRVEVPAETRRHRGLPRGLQHADMQRLKRIFASGVCDWSKPGVSQVRSSRGCRSVPRPRKGSH
jgi:hypothetical protein